MNEIIKYAIATTIVLFFSKWYYFTYKHYKKTKLFVESHNKRIDSTKFQLDDYLKQEQYIKCKDWLKQKNGGIKDNKEPIKVYDYSEDCDYLIVKNSRLKG